MGAGRATMECSSQCYLSAVVVAAAAAVVVVVVVIIKGVLQRSSLHVFLHTFYPASCTHLEARGRERHGGRDGGMTMTGFEHLRPPAPARPDTQPNVCVHRKS